jgi:hypothetical protein
MIVATVSLHKMDHRALDMDIGTVLSSAFLEDVLISKTSRHALSP